jgi:hypothetical protein
MYNPVSEECKEAISNCDAYCGENIMPIIINYSDNLEDVSNDNFTMFYEEIQRRPYEQ